MTEYQGATPFERAILTRLDVQGNDIAEIRDDMREVKKHVASLRRWRARMRGVRKTVGQLERWRARSEGVRFAYRWVETLLGVAVAAGATAFVAFVVH